MSTTVKLGISTCPNDTFAFHGLLAGKVDCRGLSFQVELLDIEQLNQRMFAGTLDVAKVSFHAAVLASQKIWVMPTGSALGFGVGPLLLSSAANVVPTQSAQIALCPGEHTTATLLFRLFYSSTATIHQVVFSEIMPRLRSRSADFGVCIHEGRFTWRDQALYLVEDLGERWERDAKCPLPLGGIVASRSIPEDRLHRVQQVLHDSLQYGLSHRHETVFTMRRYAQEFSDDVLYRHVDLYVNEWTENLGSTGLYALQELSRRAGRVGIVDGNHTLEIWQN